MPNKFKVRKNPGGLHIHSDGKHYNDGDILTLGSKADFKGIITQSFTPLDGLPVSQDDKDPETELVLKHKGAGKYDVINTATGEPLNDAVLTKEDALKFVKEAG